MLNMSIMCELLILLHNVVPPGESLKPVSDERQKSADIIGR